MSAVCARSFETGGVLVLLFCSFVLKIVAKKFDLKLWHGKKHSNFFRSKLELSFQSLFGF